MSLAVCKGVFERGTDCQTEVRTDYYQSEEYSLF